MSLNMTAHKDRLLEKIKNRDAVVAIYGLGYVGLPLALRFAEVGFATIGFDIDADKVGRLNAGQSYIERIPATRINAAISFTATTDYAQTARADALIICTPTPLGKHREPDLRFVINTVDGIAAHLRAGQLVSLESTTYPGTTEEELLPRIQSRGFTVGRDAFLVYSPEREDPGNENFAVHNTPKICGGHSADCLQVGAALYQSVVAEIVPVADTRTAEMAKLLENIYRAVNIGLVNELGVICDKMNIDIYEVIRLAATKPFGFTAFYPGPGTGGHCLPIDPFYLSWKAKEYGVDSKFIELAGEVNANMPAWHAARAVAKLNQAGKSVRDARILILGVAYKKNMDDLRESPALKIIEILLAQGANITYCDPHVANLNGLRDYDFDLQAQPLTAKLLGKSDAVIICTDHDLFDYSLIVANSSVLVDTRGVVAGLGENQPPRGR